MPSWPKMPFDAADAELDLTRYGFDVDFDSAYVHTGSIHVDGDWSGGELLRRCGLDPDGSYLGELTAFVIDGDLTIDGTLDLDEGAKECFALMVTGTLRAQILTLDATMLFVFGGARIARLINFTTTDGTLSIAGTTDCPLVICDEGDLNLHSSGHVLCRMYDSMPANGYEAAPDEWPQPTVTLGRAEVPRVLSEGLYDGTGWVDSSEVLKWAREGRPLLAEGSGSAQRRSG